LIKPELKLNKLTALQQAFVTAIEKKDHFAFSTSLEQIYSDETFDFNFEITTDGTVPLMLAASKGK
jgi:hypothetical protein